jgi:hypothetical protein
MSLAIICGCIPISLSYWEPAAPGGRLLNSIPGTIGYKDMLELSFNDVKVQLLGVEYGLSVDLLIPEGRSASFVADELELYEGQFAPKMIKFTMTVWDKRTLKSFQISPMSVMYGKNTNIALLGGPQPKSYPSSIEFGGGDRARYSVKLPPLKIGDQVFNIPVVEFTRKEGFGIGPVN